MKKILIISNENQESLRNFKNSEAFRIRSHCQSIFCGDEIYIFSENAIQEIREDNVIFIKNDFSSLIKRMKGMDAVLLFQNSHFSSNTYKIARMNIGIKKIIDLYNPLHFEKLSYESDDSFRYKEVVDSINTIISAGDYFICASGKQYDYYLGVLSNLGKINSNDKQLLPISIIPTDLGECKRSFLSKKATKDFVFFGSVYPWFDSQITLNFVRRIIKNKNNITFFGLKNPEVKGIYQDKVDEIKKGLSKLDKNYIFFEDWSDSRELSNKLSKYKMAVNFVQSTSLEDEFAYRTRFLTLLSNGIPILTNGRDQISREIIRDKAGYFYNAKNNIDYLDNAEKLTENCIKLYEKLSLIKIEEKNKLRDFVENRENKEKLFSVDKFIQSRLYWFRKNFSGNW